MPGHILPVIALALRYGKRGVSTLCWLPASPPNHPPQPCVADYTLYIGLLSAKKTTVWATLIIVSYLDGGFAGEQLRVHIYTKSLKTKILRQHLYNRVGIANATDVTEAKLIHALGAHGQTKAKGNPSAESFSPCCWQGFAMEEIWGKQTLRTSCLTSQLSSSTKDRGLHSLHWTIIGQKDYNLSIHNI